MTYTYDAFSLKDQIVLIRRNRYANLRNDSDGINDLVQANDIISKNMEDVVDTMEFVDVVDMRSKQANTFDMDEISLIKAMLNLSLDFINLNTTDILVMALAKECDDENIFYLGVVDEDSRLFENNPIVID